MRKVVATAKVAAGDVVLEVGPGTGSLSEMLLETGARVIAVEIDHGLQALLRGRFADQPNFTLIAGDALARKHELNPELVTALVANSPEDGGARKLVANLPYQIATPLLLELLYAEPAMASLTCTIQKEVGDRLAAAPRTPAYGPISVIAQTLAEIREVALLPPAAFWPRPKVDSVLLSIVPLPASEVEVDDVPAFVRLVRDAFAQRRKMLRRVLADLDPPVPMAALEAAGVSPSSRPEELTPANWRALHHSVRRLSDA